MLYDCTVIGDGSCYFLQVSFERRLPLPSASPKDLSYILSCVIEESRSGSSQAPRRQRLHMIKDKQSSQQRIPSLAICPSTEREESLIKIRVKENTLKKSTEDAKSKKPYLHLIMQRSRKQTATTAKASTNVTIVFEECLPKLRLWPWGARPPNADLG